MSFLRRDNSLAERSFGRGGLGTVPGVAGMAAVSPRLGPWGARYWILAAGLFAWFCRSARTRQGACSRLGE